MEKEKIQYFKKRLQKEKERVNKLLRQMEINETINSNSEMASELSFYDNHPSDIASEMFDKEKGLALKENEVTLLKKIDGALESIDRGAYGKCKMCGENIIEERLDFIPYAEYCVTCQNVMNSVKPPEKDNRSAEEDVLSNPFGYGYNDFKDDSQFDAEDSYQSVERFNRIENIVEYYEDDENDGYVENIEKISNEQYKNQLPD